MRQYELVCIIKPDQDETAMNDAVDKVKNWITDDGGEITQVKLWGKRKLAYPILKLTEGQYILLNMNMSPNACATLDRNLRFFEPVIRYLLITKE